MLTWEEEMCNRQTAAGPMCVVEVLSLSPLRTQLVMWPGRPESERDLGGYHARIVTDPEDPCDPLETMWFDCAEVEL